MYRSPHELAVSRPRRGLDSDALRGRCVNLTLDETNLSQWICELVFELPEGNIAMAGPFDLLAESAVFAVTGGTGAFRNAGGEVEVVPVPGYEDGRSYAIFRLLGATAKY